MDIFAVSAHAAAGVQFSPQWPNFSPEHSSATDSLQALLWQWVLQDFPSIRDAEKEYSERFEVAGSSW